MSSQVSPSPEPEVDRIVEAINRLQGSVATLVVPRHCMGTRPIEEGKDGLYYRNDDGSKMGYVTRLTFVWD